MNHSAEYYPRVCNETADEYPSINNCVHVFFVVVADKYTVSIKGYVMPILVLITFVTNSLVCVVLLRKNMRSPTNTILVAMAVSDMLTGAWTLPCYVYFYAMGAHEEFVPYSWCLVYFWLTDYLPTVFHSASVWLTVALAAQRYIYVCHNVGTKHLFTVKNMAKVVVIVYLVAFAYQLPRCVEYSYGRVKHHSNLDPETAIIGCHFDFRPFVASHEDLYYSVYFWFRVIFLHLGPCTALALLNALLSRAMHRANLRMKQLLRQNRRSECRRLEETNSTTVMLVVVVAVTIVAEFPMAVYFIVTFFENIFQIALMEENLRYALELFTNLILLFSYPFNFFIYCAMSRQFRETFKALCSEDVVLPFASRQQSADDSYQAENGNKEATQV